MKIKEKFYVLFKKLKKFYKAYFTEEGTYTSLLSDKTYLKKLYKKRMGKELNLKNPKTFAEKLNWLKLYNRRPEYTVMADKYAVREYIKEKIGEEYLVPLIGVWDRIEDIDFDSLPEKFVLKCNHDNGVIICRDKSSFDIESAKKQLEFHLNRDYYRKCREWPYKNIKKKIICEEYLEQRNGRGLIDYKFFCFDGKADSVMVCLDRDINDVKFYFFDKSWTLKRYNKRGKKAPPDFTVAKPERIDEMFSIAEKLSDGIAFLRVDLYECNGKIYFGELTFFPDGGFDTNILPEYDEYFGSLVEISKRRL